MKKLFSLILLLCFASTAEARVMINPYTGRQDFTGVSASGDITTVCDSGNSFISSGGGNWACGTNGAGTFVKVDQTVQDTTIGTLKFPHFTTGVSGDIIFTTLGAGFSMGSGSATYNGVRDDLQVWGYNIGQPTGSEPSLYFDLESKYNNAGSNYLEHNFDYVSGATNYRALHYQMDRATFASQWAHYATIHYIGDLNGNNNNIYDFTDSNNPKFGWGTLVPFAPFQFESTGTKKKMLIGQQVADSATASTSINGAASYLHLGNAEYNTGSYRLITLGYATTAQSFFSAFIGYQEQDSNNSTSGDIVMGTRNVNSDTAPTVKLRISGDGTITGTTFSGAHTGSLSGATGLPLTTGVTGVLPIANGGTNVSSLTSTGFYHVNNGAFDTAARAVNLASADVTGTLPVGNGGTGLATYVQGDLIVATGTTTLASVSKDTATTRYLANTGASNKPSWDLVNVATGVQNTLGVANGGLGITTAPSNGFFPIGNGSTYTAAALTASADITIVNSSGGASIGLSADITIPGSITDRVTALTDAATIAIDASLGNIFTVTLGGNRAMGKPTNPKNGQKIILRISQDSTGTRTLTWPAGNGWRFGSDVTTPTLSTTAGMIDYVGTIYNTGSPKNSWDVVSVSKGYQT